MQNFYYVYAHLNPDTKRVFYIGKGIDDRAYSHKGRNDLWHKYIKNIKNSHKILILKNGLSEKQALKLEEKLISKLGIASFGGPLVNIEGPIGGFIKDLSIEELFNKEYENQFKDYSEAEVIRELLDFSNWNYALEIEKEFQHIFDLFHQNYDQLKQISDPKYFWELEDALDQIKHEFLFNFKHNATTGTEFYEDLAFIESDILSLLNSNRITEDLRIYVSKTHSWISRLLDSSSSLLKEKAT